MRPGWCISSSTFCISTARTAAARPLIERKASLSLLLSAVAPPLYYSDYHRARGPAFHDQACKLELEGIVSKRAHAPYTPAIAVCGSRSNAALARNSW
jgi:ATP-dependent DNA ligase